MKTRINQILLVTLFAFFLLAGNVKAEGTERHHASSLENSNNLKQLLWDCYLGEASGNNIEIEDWMFNEDYQLKSGSNNVQIEEAINPDNVSINDSIFSSETVNVVENRIQEKK